MKTFISALLVFLVVGFSVPVYACKWYKPWNCVSDLVKDIKKAAGKFDNLLKKLKPKNPSGTKNCPLGGQDIAVLQNCSSQLSRSSKGRLSAGCVESMCLVISKLNATNSFKVCQKTPTTMSGAEALGFISDIDELLTQYALQYAECNA